MKKKEERILVVMSTEEKEILKSLADNDGRSMSGYLRSLFMRENHMWKERTKSI